MVCRAHWLFGTRRGSEGAAVPMNMQFVEVSIETLSAPRPGRLKGRVS
jgi:hypothetical protein